MAKQDTNAEGGVKELLVPLVVVTLLGGGGGGFLGFSMLAPKEPPRTEARVTETPAVDPDATKAAHGDAGHGAKAEAHGQEHGSDAAKAPDGSETLQVKELPPIVTNLATTRILVRLQTAIVFDPQELKHAETLIPELMSDLTAFMNTLDLRDIEGPDGLRRLREELNERALIRSERHVRELVIESLVIQ